MPSMTCTLSTRVTRLRFFANPTSAGSRGTELLVWLTSSWLHILLCTARSSRLRLKLAVNSFVY
jgi:hypothetical protein